MPAVSVRQICTALLFLGVAVLLLPWQGAGGGVPRPADRLIDLQGGFTHFDWEVGDRWIYLYTYDYGGVTQTGTYAFRIDRISEGSVLMRFDGNGTISWADGLGRGSWNEEGYRTLSAESLGMVSSRAWMNITFTEPAYHREETFIAREHEPERDLYAFPISRGEEWLSRDTVLERYSILLDGQYYDMDGNPVSGPVERIYIETFLNYDAGELDITTPGGGRVSTRVVHSESGDGSRVAYLSERSGIEARIEWYDASHELIRRLELLSSSRERTFGSSLSVRVYGVDGATVPGASVTLHRDMAGSLQPLMANTTGPDGSAVFDHLVPGVYVAHAISEGGFEGGTGRVTLGTNASLTLEIHLMRVRVNLTLTVVDWSGRPVPSARVRAAAAGVYIDSMTDADGRSAMPVLSGTPLTVTVEKQGFDPAEVHLTLEDDLNISLVLEGRGRGIAFYASVSASAAVSCTAVITVLASRCGERVCGNGPDRPSRSPGGRNI